jgi:hypothetical protein
LEESTFDDDNDDADEEVGDAADGTPPVRPLGHAEDGQGVDGQPEEDGATGKVGKPSAASLMKDIRYFVHTPIRPQTFRQLLIQNK